MGLENMSSMKKLSGNRGGEDDVAAKDVLVDLIADVAWQAE
jgi:hypothetical protein